MTRGSSGFRTHGSGLLRLGGMLGGYVSRYLALGGGTAGWGLGTCLGCSVRTLH